MTAQLSHALPQLLSVDDGRLGVERDVERARKLCLARVAPAVLRAALDSHITALHQPLLAALELELDLALDADANVERNGAMPDLGGLVGVIVDLADGGAAGDHEGRFLGEVVGVGGQVGVLGQGRGEGGEGVDEGEVAA